MSLESRLRDSLQYNLGKSSENPLEITRDVGKVVVDLFFMGKKPRFEQGSKEEYDWLDRRDHYIEQVHNYLLQDEQSRNLVSYILEKRGTYKHEGDGFDRFVSGLNLVSDITLGTGNFGLAGIFKGIATLGRVLPEVGRAYQYATETGDCRGARQKGFRSFGTIVPGSSVIDIAQKASYATVAARQLYSNIYWNVVRKVDDPYEMIRMKPLPQDRSLDIPPRDARITRQAA